MWLRRAQEWLGSKKAGREEEEKQVLSERLSGHRSARTRTPQETAVNYWLNSIKKKNQKQMENGFFYTHCLQVYHEK